MPTSAWTRRARPATFGITLDDSVTIHNTDLRFTGVDTRTLEQLIPDLQLAASRPFAGRAIVSGGRHALALERRRDLRRRERRREPRDRGVGDVGFPGHGVRATNLRAADAAGAGRHGAHVDAVAADQRRRHRNGDGERIDGRRAPRSSATSTTAIAARGRSSTARRRCVSRAAHGSTSTSCARPVSLVEVGRFFPVGGTAGQRGRADSLSPARLRDLRVERRPPTARRRTSRRRAARSTSRAATRATIFTARAVHAQSAHGHRQGAGDVADGERRRARPRLRPGDDARRRSTRISRRRGGTASASTPRRCARHIGDGLRRRAALYAAGVAHDGAASGTFGLTRERSGHAHVSRRRRFARRVQSLDSEVAPAHRRRRAAPARHGARHSRARKADSARLDRATRDGAHDQRQAGPEARGERAEAGAGGHDLRLGARGGNAARQHLRVRRSRARRRRARSSSRGNYVRAFESEYAWLNARTPQAKLAVGVDADSVSAMGFAFDTVNVRAHLSHAGRTRRGRRSSRTSIAHTARRATTGCIPIASKLRLADLTLPVRHGVLVDAASGVDAWGGPGVRVTDFELRDRGNGRIYANGLLPTEGSADFTPRRRQFPGRRTSSTSCRRTSTCDGNLTLHGTMTRHAARAGIPRHVRVSRTGRTTDGRARVARHVRLRRSSELVAHVDALRRTGQPMATVDAHVPINLAITGVTGRPAAADADVRRPRRRQSAGRADSAVHRRRVERARPRRREASRCAERSGTRRSPAASRSSTATMTLTSTGATIEGIDGAAAHGERHRVRRLGRRIGEGAGATARHARRGRLARADVQSVPDVERRRVAEQRPRQASRRRGLALTGPFRTAYLSGAVTVTQGVIYAPEPTGRHVIGAGDPALFNVIDTAIVTDRELFPPQSPLLANLRMDVAAQHPATTPGCAIARRTSRSTPTIRCIIHAEQEAFALTGVVTSDRGEYNFLSKRFQIKRGSAMFIGSPDLNPTLQITGEYRGAAAVARRAQHQSSHRRHAAQADAVAGERRAAAAHAVGAAQSSRVRPVGDVAAGDRLVEHRRLGGDVGPVRRRRAGRGATARRRRARRRGRISSSCRPGRAFGTDVFDITPADVPSGNIVGNLFTQTKFEAGKYVNPRTFVTVQTQARALRRRRRASHGGRLAVQREHRAADSAARADAHVAAVPRRAERTADSSFANGDSRHSAI